MKHAPNVRLQLAQLTENPVILAEPVAKNTAPAIALGTKYILEKSGEDPVILVVPSDHMINNTTQFINTQPLAIRHPASELAFANDYVRLYSHVLF